MVRLLISIAIRLAASAVGLLVADLVLDDLSVEWQAFVIAVAIFTLVEAIAEPAILKMAITNAPALRGSVALIATFVGLLVTDIVSDGFDISGVWTWVAATVIVWLGALLAALLLPVIFVKKAVENNNRRPVTESDARRGVRDQQLRRRSPALSTSSSDPLQGWCVRFVHDEPMNEHPMPSRRSGVPSYFLGRPNSVYLRRYASSVDHMSSVDRVFFIARRSENALGPAS